MRRIIIDLSGVDSKKAFHERVREAMLVPDHYGDNLDALHDILAEYSGKLDIIVLNIDDFMAAREEYAESFLAMLEDIKSDDVRVFVAEAM
ncbi:MAG: barstar family protein [Lachnospiraceae bacterium]|nr:barstar family protein [Lachnospiraceae bacterium]